MTTNSGSPISSIFSLSSSDVMVMGVGPPIISSSSVEDEDLDLGAEIAEVS